jgi:hypothetical protein
LSTDPCRKIQPNFMNFHRHAKICTGRSRSYAKLAQSADGRRVQGRWPPTLPFARFAASSQFLSLPACNFTQRARMPLYFHFLNA